MWNATKVSTARAAMQRLKKGTETKKKRKEIKGKEKQMTERGGALEWNLGHGAESW